MCREQNHMWCVHGRHAPWSGRLLIFYFVYVVVEKHATKWGFDYSASDWGCDDSNTWIQTASARRT